MKFEEFVKHVHLVDGLHGWRFGQLVFNYLHEKNQELANHIRGSVFDMYYAKRRNINWDYLKEHWNDFKE